METYSDWLAHHGIPGMHWGERNGPPYPLRPMQYTKEELKEKKKAASGYNKELRRAQNLRYQRADIVRRRKEAAHEKRLARIENSNKTDEEKQAAFESLIRKYNDDARYHKAVDAVEAGNQKVLEILNRAENEGGLSLKETKMYAVKPYANTPVLVAQLVGGLPANMTVAAIMGIIDDVRIKNGDDPLFLDEGTDKYRVKVSKDYKNTVKSNKKKPDSEVEARDKEKERNLRALEEIKKDSTSRPNTSWYDKSGHLTETGKQGKINKAKEKDLWNIDFLEAVQNYDLPKNVMLKEYERFLNTGESYSDYATDDMDKRLRKYAER